MFALSLRCAALGEQLVEARERSRPSSILNMTKAELVEVARKELGIRPDHAMRLTMIGLRELIRRRRKASQAFFDPLMEMPK